VEEAEGQNSAYPIPRRPLKSDSSFLLSSWVKIYSDSNPLIPMAFIQEGEKENDQKIPIRGQVIGGI
jgi:hypothetical protein